MKLGDNRLLPNIIFIKWFNVTFFVTWHKNYVILGLDILI